MKILSKWLRSYVPGLSFDRELADELTLRGIAVEGVFDLGPGNGSLFEMDITTNRVDAMNHYGIAREAATIYWPPLPARCHAARSTQHWRFRSSCDRSSGALRTLYRARARKVRIQPSTGMSRSASAARAEAHLERCGRDQLRHHGHGTSHACLRSGQA